MKYFKNILIVASFLFLSTIGNEALGAFPGSFPSDVGSPDLVSGSFIGNVGAAATHDFTLDVEDGTYRLSASSTPNSGGRFEFFGPAHASKAGDWTLGSGSHNVIQYTLGNTLTYGHNATYRHVYVGTISSAGQAGSANLTLVAPDADETVLSLESAAGGVVRIRWAEDGDEANENFAWSANFGATHTLSLGATTGGVGNSVLTIDRTNQTVVFGSTHVVTFLADIEIDAALNHDGSTAGFFGTAPASRTAAYTPTNVTPDRAFDADSTTLGEIADIVGTILADLTLYGLLQ